MFESSYSVTRIIIYLIFSFLVWGYNLWILNFDEENLFTLTLPLLLTIPPTTYIAFRLRAKYPSSWQKHPTMVFAGLIAGQAIGIFIAFAILFIFFPGSQP